MRNALDAIRDELGRRRNDAMCWRDTSRNDGRTNFRVRTDTWRHVDARCGVQSWLQRSSITGLCFTLWWLPKSRVPITNLTQLRRQDQTTVTNLQLGNLCLKLRVPRLQHRVRTGQLASDATVSKLHELQGSNSASLIPELQP